MPRPQKYSDTDISAVIQSLHADGEDINPARVRMRLGGGNIARIKSAIANHKDKLAQIQSAAGVPEALSKEFQQLSEQMSQHVSKMASECWTAASREAATRVREENVRLRKRLDILETELTASSNLLVKVEVERDEYLQILNTTKMEKEDILRQYDGMREGLRNAESDLRATQKTIENFERNQRQDREEIRRLQNRIEALVAECAILKMNSKNK